ncbi:pyridoxal-phosphate dependent enzyme [Bradyrhizobium sp. SRL28]|uniref:pyridoxal-phosphate dependent enzyme n=1 Tax=Bradyrhizobium sp. SRL28 TaxID=2836178 RepID=UPI001BDE5838|nr:pyridoxal-phosphate dependent enzyme [Bradyrhizobium sp. SRL28]MBT1517469.1 pyridoxal-phosphate dependent enzyme [Bradyrhizobium sp. SRL28]
MADMLSDIIGAHSPLKIVSLRLGNLAAIDFRIMKVFPAFNIIETGLRNGDIGPNAPVVETSSGTMGLGLAIVCMHFGLKLHIFGDRAIEPPLKRTMEDLGAEVHLVDATAFDPNVQLLRKRALLDFIDRTGATWSRQYDNLSNRLAYARPAEEAIRQFGTVDVLVATVGSGGSSCGLAHYCRAFFPEMKLVGVDTFGSVLFGHPAGRRDLRGLGNSILPGNLLHEAFDEVHWLGANEAYQAAHRLHRETSLKRGPTSGAAYLVAKWYAERFPGSKVLAVFPDDSNRYEHNVYDPAWMQERGYRAEIAASEPILVHHPLHANGGWCRFDWSRRSLTHVMGISHSAN